MTTTGMPGEEDDQDIVQPNLQQAPRTALDTPFDREATELMANIEQQLQQRLLGSQHTSSSAVSNASHATINIELQQARHLIAELQRYTCPSLLAACLQTHLPLLCCCCGTQ